MSWHPVNSERQISQELQIRGKLCLAQEVQPRDCMLSAADCRCSHRPNNPYEAAGARDVLVPTLSVAHRSGRDSRRFWYGGCLGRAGWGGGEGGVKCHRTWNLRKHTQIVTLNFGRIQGDKYYVNLSNNKHRCSDVLRRPGLWSLSNWNRSFESRSIHGQYTIFTVSLAVSQSPTRSHLQNDLRIFCVGIRWAETRGPNPS
jgi:hypothetical protein